MVRCFTAGISCKYIFNQSHRALYVVISNTVTVQLVNRHSANRFTKGGLEKHDILTSGR